MKYLISLCLLWAFLMCFVYGCVGNQCGWNIGDKNIGTASVEGKILTRIQDAIKASEFGKGNVAETGVVKENESTIAPVTNLDIEATGKKIDKSRGN